MPVRFSGKRVVIGNLRKQINSIEKRTAAGLLAAGLFVKAEAQEITPHDKGFLVNSAYVGPVSVRKGRQFIEVGYTAKYAPFVHEMPPENNFSKAGTGPKFLQNALFRNTLNILEIIKARVKR